jgi:hypothetical protein
MTLADVAIAVPLPPQGRASPVRDAALLVGCWVLLAGAGLAADFGRLPDGVSTDDAMRLVGVRDFLAGQPWFDLSQHRLGPFGASMHWSRLIDLPIALLLQGLKLFFSDPLAERLTLAIWPLLVLLPALAGLRAVGAVLGDARAGNAALVLGVFLLPQLGHFRLGAIDHHNVQIALLLWATAWGLRSTPRAAMAAAVAMSLSLAIGLEMLPGIAVLAASVGVRWILYGDRVQRASIGFGAVFAIGAGALLLATSAPARWFVPACDALSIVHAAAACIGGAGLVTLALACRGRSAAVRGVGAGVLVAMLVALVIVMAPQCLAGPYGGVHATLQEFWLANVAETQTFLTTLKSDPVDAVALYCPPIAALVLATVIAIRARGSQAWCWGTVAALQCALLAVAMWEFRGTASANVIATATLPAALIRLVPAHSDAPPLFGLRRLPLVLMLVLTPLLLAASGRLIARAASWIGGESQPAEASSQSQCRDVSSYAALASLPPGRVLAFIDSGPFILMRTPHMVFAAPYHRNNSGNLVAVEAFLARPVDARQRLRAMGVDYVVVCAGAPELKLYRRATDGLAARLAGGAVPAYLQPLSLGDNPLQAFRFVGD